MSVANQVPKSTGPLKLAFSLLFVAPSALALFAAQALVHRAFPSPSALWLVYEISFYVGIAGIVLIIALVVAGITGRTISPAYLWLMAIAVCFAIFFEWYATRIFRDPWAT